VAVLVVVLVVAAAALGDRIGLTFAPLDVVAEADTWNHVYLDLHLVEKDESVQIGVEIVELTKMRKYVLPSAVQALSCLDCYCPEMKNTNLCSFGCSVGADLEEKDTIPLLLVFLELQKGGESLVAHDKLCPRKILVQ
jgi:hypothetical protein